ncbi:DUF3427 domain-containing protein [Halorhodospira halophila]|nr:DUF3427 domain-containing protein [Halorhodospira halophila]
MRTFARLRAVLDPLAVAVGQSFQRQEIPQLFGVEYSAGAWQSGHVVLPDSRTHILLVTLNKQGKGADYRYLDYFIDERTFHWQSQNQTTPESKRGRELIEHRQRGIDVHLFVRDHKLGPDGRAAPFRYTLREPMMTTSDDMTPFGYLEAQQDRDPLAHLEVVDPIRSGIPVATAEEMLHAVGLSLKELADLSGRGAACALADRRRGVEPVAQSPASGRV